MIQTVQPVSVPFDEVLSADLEHAFQIGIREALVRNAKLGFPAVGCENGQIVRWSPERVLAEFAAEVATPNVGGSN